jgi:hypothetical protein
MTSELSSLGPSGDTVAVHWILANTLKILIYTSTIYIIKDFDIYINNIYQGMADICNNFNTDKYHKYYPMRICD